MKKFVKLCLRSSYTLQNSFHFDEILRRKYIICAYTLKHSTGFEFVDPDQGSRFEVVPMGLLDPSWFQDKFLEQSDDSAMIPNDSMTRVLATLPKVIEKITSFIHSRFRELTKRAFIIKRKVTNQYIFQLFSLSVLRWMMIRSPSKFRLCKFVYFSAGIVELTSTRSITDYRDTNYEKAMIRRCSQMLKLADSMTRVLASKSANTFLIETIGMSTLDLYWSNMSCQNRTLYQKELRKSRMTKIVHNIYIHNNFIVILI